MFRILDRYIFKEAAQTWLSVTGVLLFILLSNQFARVLGDAAKDKLPKDAVFEVIGLTAVQYLTILVPIGLFISIMLALARFYRDSEMAAMMACRVGPASLYRPLAFLAIPLSLLVGALALVIGPQAVRQVDQISANAKREIDLTAIQAGRFTPAGGDSVIYVESIADDGTLNNVFLQRRSGSSVEVVLAKRGRQRDAEDENTRFFVFEEGRRYEGTPGDRAFQIIEFAEHGIPYRLPEKTTAALKPESQSTQALIEAGDRESIAELQWRISVPLSALLLSCLAIPLARSRPREGRYSKLAFGILLYIIYFNLLGAAKVWVEKGQISTQIGLWWVHGAVALLTIYLLSQQYGWWQGITARKRA